MFVASIAFGLSGSLVAFAAGPAAVNLGSAGNFVILAKTGISTTGATVVVGNIGVSPAAASYITGFALSLPLASAFSTSALVTGNVYAPGYADPTPAMITTAVGDMQNAYTDAAGRTNPTATELGAGNIGGMTLAPGLYKWGTGVVIPTSVTLSGSSNDVWIFQIAQNLNVSSGADIILSGGAQASNVFWVVAGQTTIGTTAVVNGNILDQTSIVVNTGAQLNGRALAQAAVTLDADVVSGPSQASAPISPAVVTPVAVTPVPAVTVVPSANNPGLMYTQTQTQTTQPGLQVASIAVSLMKGSRGSNVTLLQQFLISQNKGSSAETLANVGATGYFGALTRAALAEFQAKVNISPPLGNFGPITRAYLVAHY
jgi:hypothetical protein